MKSGLNTLSFWFGSIMVLVVLSGAFAFSFTDLMSDTLFGSRRTFFIVLLFSYATYRGFRLYQILKQQRHHHEH